jgi:hypothetical protein
MRRPHLTICLLLLSFSSYAFDSVKDAPYPLPSTKFWRNLTLRGGEKFLELDSAEGFQALHALRLGAKLAVAVAKDLDHQAEILKSVASSLSVEENKSTIFRATLANALKQETFDVIFWHADCLDVSFDIRFLEHLKNAKTLLSEDGSLIVGLGNSDFCRSTVYQHGDQQGYSVFLIDGGVARHLNGRLLTVEAYRLRPRVEDAD